MISPTSAATHAASSKVWLVDLTGDRVEVQREPTPGGYRQARQDFLGRYRTPGSLLKSASCVHNVAS